MKYIVLLGDGMADEPLAELGMKTPLESADTPNMDIMAAKGTLGLVETIPSGFAPGSDVANLSVLGYDPHSAYTGRGPLEAANMNVKLGPDDVAFRCNLVTIEDGKMADYSAGHISSAEAEAIILDLNRKFGSDSVRFVPGISYRHLTVWKKGSDSAETTPPHDIVGSRIENYLPKGAGSEDIRSLMASTREFLSSHPVNLARIEKGKAPANSVWLWGQGRAPRIEPLSARYNLKGGIISAVNLLNGIGVYAGLAVIKVEGATGYIDTNYEGKARRALESLRDLDFVFVHVEAPDEMGHEGNVQGKIGAIEDFDKKVLGPVLREIPQLGDFRILVLSDHPTPIRIRTHSSGPSPFAVFSSFDKENMAKGLTFGEAQAGMSGIRVAPGHLLMDYFIRGWGEFVDEKCGARRS
jgi:2,3-bisphosphoglycerate-independent phosphoglycerate mutase